MVGKWHLGYATDAHLPESRGFDSYLGYMSPDEQYYVCASPRHALPAYSCRGIS